MLFFMLMLLKVLAELVNEKTSTPVEKGRIDSITKENDKLILEVETLDSIKDVKTIEVKSLSNDSTLRLFYKLIGK